MKEQIENSARSGGIVLVAAPSQELARVKDILLSGDAVAFCQSLLVEKNKLKIKDLMAAVCYDLAVDWRQVKIPRDFERFAMQFRQALASAGKPVLLLIDRAHELPSCMLRDLPKLIQVAGNSSFTVMLMTEETDHERTRKFRKLSRQFVKVGESEAATTGKVKGRAESGTS